MLLPSALSCDSNNAPIPRLQASLFASPPLSPSSPSASGPALTNLFSTCRALQSMLSPPAQLPSPPTQHAEAPFKLRLRTRKSDETALIPRKKIAKRAPAPPRGINKRRRAEDDDMGRDDESAGEEEINSSKNDFAVEEPRTPKRQRVAPPVLPLGLERGDFHSLLLQQRQEETASSVEEDEGSKEGSDFWSTEEDRMLVELVLEKLKLSKSDWQDCARSLGKNRGSVGKRWKSLMAGGEVGLKGRHGSSRRAKLHSTWR